MQNKSALIIPRRNSGGVESYSLNLNKIGTNRTPVDIIYLSDYKIPDNSIKSLFLIHRFLTIVKPYEKIICHGQFGYISLFHIKTTTIIHGNPINYLFKASSWRRIINPKSWILAITDFTLIYLALIFSEKLIFVADHVKNSFFISKYNFINYKSQSNTTKYIASDSSESTRNSNNYIAILSDAHHEKGLDRLIKIAEFIDINITVYGTTREIKNRSDNISYYGKVDHKQIINAIKSTNLLFHLSRYEGLPLVLLEALSYGVPCVVIEEPWTHIFKDLESVLIINKIDLWDKKKMTAEITKVANFSALKVKNDYQKFLQILNFIEDLK